MNLEHPALLVDLAGGRFSLSARTFLMLFRSRQGRFYLGLVLLALIVLDAHDLLPGTPFPAIVAIAASALALYLGLLTAGLFCAGQFQRWSGLRRIPLPLLTLAAALPTIRYAESLSLLLSQGHPVAAGPFSLAVLLIFAEIFTLIFVRYVRPLALAECEATQDVSPDATSEVSGPEQEDPPGRRILIGAEPVPLDKLIVIEAREHHVHVTLEGATQTQRARLGDIVAQTSTDDGLQPHRSWWVARRAAVALDEQDGRPVLTLRDGTTVPVARARLPAVRDWLDRTG